MSPDVTIKISFGPEGATVATSSSATDVPPPMPIEQLRADASDGTALPRPSDSWSGPGLSESPGGPPGPMPIEQLGGPSPAAVILPQPTGAPDAGGPPGPMPLEQLGSAGASPPEPLSPDQLASRARQRRASRARR